MHGFNHKNHCTKINDGSSCDGGGYFSGTTTTVEASSSGLHNSNCAGDLNLRGYLTPISARKSATMTSITHLESQKPQQKQQQQHDLHPNKYSQPNLNTIYTLKNSSSSSNDNNTNNKVEYTKPQIYLPYNNLFNYSVDERNYRGESVPPTPLLSKNKQQQKQHFLTFNNKNATITNQNLDIDNIHKQNYNIEPKQIHLPKNQQHQQQVQKHYRNATSGNGLNLMSHFKSLVNVSQINFKYKFNFFF